MTYANLSELYRRFGQDEIDQVADDEQVDLPAPERIDRALADADGEINAYLGVRYRTPLDPPPQLIVRLACDLAREFLYANRIPEDVAARGAVVREMLKALAKGDLMIDADPAPATQGGTVMIQTGRVHSPWSSPRP